MKTDKEQMASHVKQWQESGLSQAAYARQHDVAYHRLKYWTQRLALPQHGSDSPAFLPVSAEGHERILGAFTASERHSVRLLIDKRVEIIFPVGCSPAYIAAVGREIATC
jgi:transposase-like protein